jgi:hypothetical protein
VDILPVPFCEVPQKMLRNPDFVNLHIDTGWAAARFRGADFCGALMSLAESVL